MLEVFKKRHSVRSFQKKEVSPEQMEEILKAFDSAPSAGNLKAREVMIIKDQKTKAQLASAAYSQDFIKEAPLVLVIFALPEKSALKYGERGYSLYALEDATIAGAFAWLEAVNQGLSACWVGAFDEEKVRKILQKPPAFRPIVIMPLGYEKVG